jgi:hypothetical protein
MTKFKGFATALLFALCCFVDGCKGKVPNDPVPVKGKVQYSDGAPAGGIMVWFQPLDDSNQENFPSVETTTGGGV